MATSTTLNRRLLSAVLRAPRPLSTRSHQLSTPVVWVRTITTKGPGQQDVPKISFGAENDAVISQYMRPGKKLRSEKPATQSKSKDGKETASRTSGITKPADGYEISGYIDRSTPARRETETPLSEAKADPQNTDQVKRARENKGEPSAYRGRRNGNPLKIIERVPRTYIRAVKNREPESNNSNHRYEKWMEQRNALKEKFPEGWNPRKKLSPDAMDGIRGLHEQDPIKYSTPVLAEQFKVSAEAIRRILKSKWASKAGGDKAEERRERWAKRHDRIWDSQAELGLRPQRKKEMDVEDPDKFEKDVMRQEILGKM